MRTALRHALTEAIKAQDPVARSALRAALGAIENAEAVDAARTPAPSDDQSTVAGSVVGLGAADVERRVLSDADLEDLLRAEVADRLSAAQAYQERGRVDRAERLRAEAAVLSKYLPDR